MKMTTTIVYLQVLSPFYIFQIFSCSLWYADEYEYYASCIVLISTISITVTIYQTRKVGCSFVVYTRQER